MAQATSRFINRELSWLEFNQRVLDEAGNADVPLLERLNFISITASNLDEFFMVRVGGLKQLAEHNIAGRDPSGMTPSEQLRKIAHRAGAMVKAQYGAYGREIEPLLARSGIVRRTLESLEANQRSRIERVLSDEVMPVISPMALDSKKRASTLANMSMILAVRMKADGSGKPVYSAIPLSRALNRFVTVPADGGFEYVLLEDVVSEYADMIFPGRAVLECTPFRITRNADLSVQEDYGADLLAEMEKVLRKRKYSSCVRLELSAECSRTTRRFLQRFLDVSDEYVYEIDGPLDLSSYRSIASLEGFSDLKYKPWQPKPSTEIDLSKSVFEELARKNVLLSHPYDSFDPVQRLVSEAARDPDVLAIKQTLYRTSSNSPIMEALREAAERGKYVTALVELKARFDEARNIEWARELERSGVQVIYGIKGLKTHSKICIVVRREPGGVRRYMHFGTGNYNEKTARLYTDIGYMTSDPDLGADASAFFNAVCGYSEPEDFLKLSAAPLGLRERLSDLIEIEIERKRQGQPALIMAKMNSLLDPDIIETLYKASQAGVRVKLIVRGICSLRPGVKGLSENISVTSIVDRFLEHSRIFYFHHGGEELFYISSADWMPRNLDKRIELMTPVEDPAGRARLRNIFETCLADNVKGRILMPDGGYTQPARKRGTPLVRSQEAFCEEARKRMEDARRSQPTSFEPHLPPGDKS